ncbi:MAG: nitroreductase family deazaflavin-dependent oxidoreductase [Myxococcales bacterium]|nr:nitroreductase family deazaflavin-dependent oxidoreductase [Myxococcales bacterium]MCB9605777.1 nitroreductase family deazaflavin-dependent oxidoreductase [Polyangiaceae bacterium]
MRWFSMTTPGRAFARTVVARLDPVLYKLSGGKLTTVGPQVIPMIVLTTTGRKSGKQRSVQVAFIHDPEASSEAKADVYTVASNFGQQNHPAWSYNLQANPNCEVNLNGEVFRAKAERVSDEEKARVWPKLVDAVPQYAVYVTRTSRDIGVWRLRRT